jgi:uncharacterized protein (TIGR03437 family)
MKRVLCLAAGVAFLCVPVLKADTAQTISFLTMMLPANETPAITDTSVGNVIISLHVVRDSTGAITSGSVDFNVACRFSGAVTVTGLHIHSGAAGVAGGIVIPTDVSSIAVDATGRTTVQRQVQFPQTTPPVALSTITDLIANPSNYYVNIHTTDHPSGVMRGQLMLAEGKIVMAQMSAQNETPPVASTASGVAEVTLLRALDSSGNVALAEAIFNLDYTGFNTGTTFSGFHIHSGAAGVPGPVIISTGISSVPADPSGAGSLSYAVPITPLDSTFSNEVATINGLFENPNNYYINIHTTVFPSGVMRDQLKDVDRNVLQVNMLPSNEVPPVMNLAVNAVSAIVVNTLRNPDGSIAAGSVGFDVNFRGFPAATAFTGLHIHQQAAGMNGGIVIPTGLGAGAASVTTDSGNGNVDRRVTVATSAGIAALNQLVQDPSGFYVNMHTTVYPSGVIRSQLAGTLSKPAITGAAADASTITTAAPGTILSIYGTNLAAFTSDLNGFYNLTALPTSFDGVSVTIGGVKAPFYFVSPGQLNAQVPFEVAPGTQPLVVTTAAGASAAMNVTVASLAPSIFVVAPANNLGAVVKSTDFSLVTGANRVKAGDTVVIYSTGLGQTTPPVQTGVPVQPPGAGAFNNTGSVSVTIGGQNAAVVYSIASPAFVGLYQTAVTVPSGVTGNMPLILKAGSASSNSVNLPLQ